MVASELLEEYRKWRLVETNVNRGEGEASDGNIMADLGDHEGDDEGKLL